MSNLNSVKLGCFGWIWSPVKWKIRQEKIEQNSIKKLWMEQLMTGDCVSWVRMKDKWSICGDGDGVCVNVKYFLRPSFLSHLTGGGNKKVNPLGKCTIKRETGQWSGQSCSWWSNRITNVNKWGKHRMLKLLTLFPWARATGSANDVRPHQHHRLQR